MTILEELRAAVDRLDELIHATVDAGEVTAETAKTALLMMSPVARILRGDIDLLSKCDSDEMLARVERATERAGDLALAKAILGYAKGMHS